MPCPGFPVRCRGAWQPVAASGLTSCHFTAVPEYWSRRLCWPGLGPVCLCQCIQRPSSLERRRSLKARGVASPWTTRRWLWQSIQSRTPTSRDESLAPGRALLGMSVSWVMAHATDQSPSRTVTTKCQVLIPLTDGGGPRPASRSQAGDSTSTVARSRLSGWQQSQVGGRQGLQRQVAHGRAWACTASPRLSPCRDMYLFFEVPPGMETSDAATDPIGARLHLPDRPRLLLLRKREIEMSDEIAGSRPPRPTLCRNRPRVHHRCDPCRISAVWREGLRGPP